MENCYLMLKSVLKNIKSIDGVIFYSVFMLPEKNEERKKILTFFIKNKKKIYFALEEFSLVNLGDLRKVNEIFKIKKNTSNS